MHRISPRRVVSSALPLTALTLAMLAGCAAETESVAQPSATPAAPARAANANGPDPKPDKPGSYAVIDGKKEPIPEVHLGEPATVARIIDEGTKRNHVMDQITYISNSIGPR